MTLTEIQVRLNKIKNFAEDDDDEVAHKMEDELYRDFIYFVELASRDVALVELAREVLRSKEIEFSRWYA